jgi:predicted transcriptional regulator
MTPNKIRALLVERGIRQAEIAKELGVTPPAVCAVLNGHWRSPRVEAHIAKRLGIPQEKLWPDNAA